MCKVATIVNLKKNVIFWLLSFTQNNSRSRKIIVVHAAFTRVHARSRSTFFGTQNHQKHQFYGSSWWHSKTIIFYITPMPHAPINHIFPLSWMMSLLSGCKLPQMSLAGCGGQCWISPVSGTHIMGSIFDFYKYKSTTMQNQLWQWSTNVHDNDPRMSTTMIHECTNMSFPIPNIPGLN